MIDANIEYFCFLKNKFILKQYPIRIKTWFDTSTASIYVLFPLDRNTFYHRDIKSHDKA